MKAYVVFADESGYFLIPTVRKTWAPRGQTPVLPYTYLHDRVSAISALTLSPQRRRLGLYFQCHRHNISQREVTHFIRNLLRHLRGHVVLILDRGGIHVGRQIRGYFARTRRLHVEYFPGYAPKLNPDEGVWGHTKRSLANLAPPDQSELLVHVLRALGRLARRPSVLRGFIHHAKMTPFLE